MKLLFDSFVYVGSVIEASLCSSVFDTQILYIHTRTYHL